MRGNARTALYHNIRRMRRIPLWLTAAALSLTAGLPALAAQESVNALLVEARAAYEKDSPRAGEADLIVAKHRNGPTDTITVAFQGHFSRFTDMAPEV